MRDLSHMSALALVLLVVAAAPPLIGWAIWIARQVLKSIRRPPPSRGPHPPADLDAHEEA